MCIRDRPNTGDELEDFSDWETRFLFHKHHCLRNEPIPSVRQTNVQMCIRDRVGFTRLMPYRYYHSRYTLNMGNPNLRPDYSNHISVTYQLAQKYNLTLTHVWSNNGLDNYNKMCIRDRDTPDTDCKLTSLR